MTKPIPISHCLDGKMVEDSIKQDVRLEVLINRTIATWNELETILLKPFEDKDL